MMLYLTAYVIRMVGRSIGINIAPSIKLTSLGPLLALQLCSQIYEHCIQLDNTHFSPLPGWNASDA